MEVDVNIRFMTNSISDYSLMSKWLSDSAVLEYYEGRDNPFNVDKVIEKFRPRVTGSSYVTSCIIQCDNADIGYMQYYEITDDAKSVFGYSKQELIYGIDLFVGEKEYWNMGIGTKAMKIIIEKLIKEMKAERIVIDPQSWNIRAIKCYEKCGFRKVKLLEKHELHEGEYKDNWLMEIKP